MTQTLSDGPPPSSDTQASAKFIRHWWQSFPTKIIAWAFVPTALVLAAVAWVTFSAYQRGAEDLVIVRNRELARFSAGDLSTRLDEYSSLLTEYAGLLGGLPKIAYADSGDLVVQSDVLLRARSRFETFDGGVFILTNQGTVVATQPDRPEIEGQDWSNRMYFRQMLRGMRPVYSDVVADGPYDSDSIVVAVPIRGDQGQFLGLMGGLFTLGPSAANAFYRDLASIGIAEEGSTYLLDGSGRVIYHAESRLIGQNVAEELVASHALSGMTGALRTLDSWGLDIVASYAPVPDAPWVLVVEESWSGLTGGVRGYQRFLILLMVLGVLIPAVVVAFGVRRITRPVQDLIRGAQEVASGNFSQDIESEATDEIGELAQQFNRMAAQLRDSYAHLEQRVEDRTRDVTALYSVAKIASQSLDLRDILDQALDRTLEVMRIEAGGIYLLDRDKGELNITSYKGLSAEFIEDIDHLRVGEGFSGAVVQSGEPLFVRDASTDTRLTRAAVREEGLRSLAVVPLRSKGAALGTLFAITRGQREFTEQDVELVASIGNQIGVAVDNAALFEDTKRRLAQVSALQQTSQAVARTLDIDTLMELIVEQATSIMHADGGILNLVDWESFEDEAVAAIGVVSATVGSRANLNSTLSGWATLHKQPTIANDLQNDSRVNREGLALAALHTGRELRNAAMAPMIAKDRVVGSLAVVDKASGSKNFTHGDLSLLTALASQAATAIENARLFQSESERRREASLLAELAKLTSGTLDIDEVLRLTAQHAMEALAVHCCCLFLFDESTGALHPAVRVGLNNGDAEQGWPDTDNLHDQLEFWPSERLRATVFGSLQPFVSEDVSAEPHLEPSELLDYQSVLVVPVEVGGRRIGALQLATRPPVKRRFTPYECEFALAMANQAAVAVENARLFDAEQRRAEQFRVVSEVGRRAASILEIDELLDQVVRLIHEAFGYDVVEIGLVEGKDLVFRAGVERGASRPFQGFRLRIGEQGITGWVAATGEPLLVQNVETDPRFVQVMAKGTRSELAVPIKTKDKVIGVLNSQSTQIGGFDESDQAVLQALADQTAIAIENARLFDAEQRRSEQFRVVNEVGRHITSLLGIEGVLEQVVRLIQDAFGYDHVGIALIEGDEAVYKVGAGRLGYKPEVQFTPSRLKIGEQGVTGWVAAMGQAALIPDVRRDERYVWMQGSDTKSELAVPIKAKDEVIGVLDVQSDRLDAFDDSDKVVLESLASQAGIAIENARLYEQAQRLAVLEERGRLARELHDAVTQTLFSASLIAETLPALWEVDEGEGRELLQELRQLNRGAMAEMRTLLLELRPAALVEAELRDLLTQLGEAVTGRTGLPVAVTVEGECRMPQEAHVALYRIAQEALNNIVKHARATEVSVELVCQSGGGATADTVGLVVSDDGVGFDDSDVEPGELGLSIMRERAESIGATLAVESEVNRGTTVQVTWSEGELP